MKQSIAYLAKRFSVKARAKALTDNISGIAACVATEYFPLFL
jgi:uncharacterized protein VirK/YbjX